MSFPMPQENVREANVSATKAITLPLLDRGNTHYTQFEFSFQTPTDIPTQFDLNEYLFRYWAGDEALKSQRQISWQRLLLAKARVPNPDIASHTLAQQINSYQRARQFLVEKNTITVADLNQANRLLEHKNPRAGMLRQVQNRVGKKNGKALFMPPAPSDVPDLMDDLIDFINDQSIPALARAIVGHSHLLAIHPFVDGNGRTARVLLEAIGQQVTGFVSPMLYRFGHNIPYVNAIRDFGVDSTKGLSNPFWQHACEQAVSVKNRVGEITTAAKNDLQRKLMLVNVSDDQRLILHALWNNPLLYPPTWLNRCGWKTARLQTALRPLVTAGVLIPRTLKNPHGAIVFECPTLLSVYQHVEKALFGYLKKP